LKTQGFQGFSMVREAGLEVADPNFIAYFASNYPSKSPALHVLRTNYELQRI